MSSLIDLLRGRPSETIERVDAELLEGTRMSLWNSVIPSFWRDTYGGYPAGGASLAERVWAANRCQQMNAQQIASMPLVHHGPPDSAPSWVSSPDPEWYPNGIGDAIHSIIEQLYGYGFSVQYVTDYYADGYPRTWTIIPSGSLDIRLDASGAREYRLKGNGLDKDKILDRRRCIQIDRNPTTKLKGSSALSAYAQQAYGMLAAANQAMTVSEGGIPQAVLKSARKLTAAQALAVQTQWAESTARRNGLPPVLPPDLSFEALSFDPADMALLETQEFDAKAIATAYGVPSVLLNMALQGGLTYQNPGALGEMWWRFELRPTATRVANAFSAQMLPRGQWVSFDAADTFAVLSEMSDDNDEQASQTAPASPGPATLAAVQ